MPYPKEKSENYSNFGGINRKSSKYLTGPTEFLDLQNVDFTTFGSLTKAWGSTQYSTNGSTSPITGLAQYIKQVNASTFIGYSYQIEIGATYRLLSTDYYRLCDLTGATFNSLYAYAFQNISNPWDFVAGNNFYGVNQYESIWWDGSTLGFLQYSLPPPKAFPINTGSNYTEFGSGGLSGYLNLAMAFRRYDGLIGPAVFMTYLIAGASGRSAVIVKLPSSGSLDTLEYGGKTLTATDWGITSLVIWANQNGGALGDQDISLTATTYAIVQGFTAYSGTDPADAYQGTFLLPATSTGTTGSGVQLLPSNPYSIELFANAMFFAGFSSTPHLVWYSRLGEFEKKDFDAFIEVRTDDGDVITCLKSYLTYLIVFKLRSTHQISGSDADTYSLVEATDQYGCLSNRSATVFEQRLWFLDSKGICEFNGANTKIISPKMEFLFDRMNIQAARTQAIMLTVKERNEVWCVIPVDGSSVNNYIVIYDYVADAWYYRPLNYPMTALTRVFGGTNQPIPYLGSQSGLIFNYGISFTTDNGTGFTCVIRSRFNSDLGNSVEKQYRRLFLDADTVSGVTAPITVNFYKDQDGSSAVLSRTMYLNNFQNRIDFGIPAKDLSVELVYSLATPLRINGYTLEYRFQRPV